MVTSPAATQRPGPPVRSDPSSARTVAPAADVLRVLQPAHRAGELTRSRRIAYLLIALLARLIIELLAMVVFGYMLADEINEFGVTLGQLVACCRLPSGFYYANRLVAGPSRSPARRPYPPRPTSGPSRPTRPTGKPGLPHRRTSDYVSPSRVPGGVRQHVRCRRAVGRVAGVRRARPVRRYRTGPFLVVARRRPHRLPLIAVAALFVFLAARGFVQPLPAVLIALAFGLGSCAWPVSSEITKRDIPGLGGAPARLRVPGCVPLVGSTDLGGDAAPSTGLSKSIRAELGATSYHALRPKATRRPPSSTMTSPAGGSRKHAAARRTSASVSSAADGRNSRCLCSDQPPHPLQ